MASVRIVLRAKKLKDGTYPLAIRIIKDRVTSFIHVGYNIKKEHWDQKAQRVKSGHPNSARLNNFLATKLAEVTNTALDLETTKKQVSSQQVKEKVKPTGGASFFSQVENYLKELKASGKYNQYTADKPRLRHFKKFLKDRDILFSEITETLLHRFTHELRVNPTIRETRKLKDGGIVPPKESLSERSVMNHLVTIRSVFTHAARNGIIDKKNSPFGADGVSIRFPQSLKIGLSEEDVALIENVQLQELYHHARNLWLFSFYFAGMRVSDVLRIKWSDIQNGRLYYAMGKNDKAGSLKVPDQAMAIIKQYESIKQGNDDYIFPELKGTSLLTVTDKFNMQRTIAFQTSRINKFLNDVVKKEAGIDEGKKLTMHIARHTFGNLSGDKIPIQMLQKLYRHSSVTTTIGYQSNFIHKDADDALESVINSSLKSKGKTQPKK